MAGRLQTAPGCAHCVSLGYILELACDILGLSKASLSKFVQVWQSEFLGSSYNPIGRCVPYKCLRFSGWQVMVYILCTGARMLHPELILSPNGATLGLLTIRKRKQISFRFEINFQKKIAL
jgi:hypothetical protein